MSTTHNVYDPKAGAAAYESLQSTLSKIPNAEVESPNADVQQAALSALTLVPFLLTANAKAKFAALPAGVFDSNMVPMLEQAALAAWYAQVQTYSEAAVADEQRVPVATVQEATSLKARMMRLLEYYFADDTEIAAELASIRVGTGYQDLATDLTRLAKLYDDERETIGADTKHFQKEDAAAARKAAEQILIALVGSANTSRTWMGRRDRAWTYLLQVFTEVCAAGKFLYRGTEDAERFAMSLVAAGRSRSRRKATPPTATATGTATTPVPPPPGEPAAPVVVAPPTAPTGNENAEVMHA